MDLAWRYLTEQILDPHKVEVLAWPFLATLVIILIHGYLGIHVIARKVIFVDIALAQIAAVGATVALLRGWELGSLHVYAYSLGFSTFAAAVFAITRTREERVPQEAVIGLSYAIAGAAAILLADLTPQGAEHLNQLVAGNALFATKSQVVRAVITYAAFGVFHAIFGRKFLLISEKPEEAYAQGVRVRLWDFLFYLTFSVAITLSVQLVGVLLVFSYLVAPAVFGAMFARRFWPRLLIGWAVAIVVTGTAFYFLFDYATCPAVTCTFGAALVLGGVVKAISSASSRIRASLVTLAAAAGLTAVGWAIVRFDRPIQDHPEHEHEREPDPHEHPIGTSIPELRKALHDPDRGVRAHAVELLGKTGDPSVARNLIPLLRDRDEEVREKAADAIGVLGAEEAIPVLSQSLRVETDEWVRMRMARALVRLGSKEGIPVLLDVARKGRARKVREEALQALLLASGRDTGRILDELGEWWQKNQDHLVWDPEKKAFVTRPP